MTNMKIHETPLINPVFLYSIPCHHLSVIIFSLHAVSKLYNVSTSILPNTS